MVTLPGYRVGNKLYESSRTWVYRGTRQRDQQPVILKLLRSNAPTLSDQIRLRNHYTIATQLNLPGIVCPIALEENGDRPFLVIPDEGLVSLQDYYARPIENLQADPLDTFFAIAVQLAEILDGLYRQRVIHKDIKPSNILIHPATGQVKLTDFGLASQLPQETQTLESPTVLEGTLAYLSPEQTGRMNRSIDYRSDFYSLGVTFYELLTGQLPFQSEDPLELVYCHLAKDPGPDLRGFQNLGGLANIVLKLMAKNAEDRYQSALGLKADLETCWQHYKTTGTITEFVLGQVDNIAHLNIPQKLYGRETQERSLLETFERVSQGSCELVMVGGYSGIGKTALVNQILQQLTQWKGYFATGKFDQFQRDIPLAGILQAYRGLLRQLLTESDERLQYWRDRFLQSLGSNAQLMIDSIPELELIIGTQPPVPELGAIESSARLIRTFNQFVQVFQSPDHPQVVFMDDVQWIDLASLRSLQNFISMEANHHCLVIVAYRDNEVSSVHPLMQTMDSIRQAGGRITEIKLNPLTLSDVVQWVADTLVSEAERVWPLAELLFGKTAGNPFFLTQLLKSLSEEGLIWFEADGSEQAKQKDRQWQWNLSQIEQCSITDNVVDLMVERISKLPASTQRVLQLAACIGNEFDLQTLATVSEQSLKQTAEELWESIPTGLIVPIGDRYRLPQVFETDENLAVLTSEAAIAYRFLHDRIQQAAYALIPEDQKQATHLDIGQLLLQNTPESELEAKIFVIVNHWNAANEIITERSDRDQAATLNLIAGRKAKASSAFAAALSYLEIGLALLPEDGWRHQYALTLTLHAETAEAAFLNADFERSQHLIDQMLNLAGSILDKVKAYDLQIQSYIAQNRLVEALQVGQGVLQLLGVTLIQAESPEMLPQELKRVALLYAETPIASLIHLPKMVAPESIAAMRILAKLWAPAAMTNPSLTLLITLKQVEVSIQSGHTSESPFAYALYASILISMNDDIEAGYEFGQLALNLLEHLDLQENRARTEVIVLNMIYPWKQAIRSTLSPLLNAYQTGLETGDIEFASYAALVYCYHGYFAGKDLPSVEQDMRVYADQLKQLNQLSGLLIQQLNHQVVLNLLHPSEAPTRLVGEACDETTRLQTESKNRMLLCYWHIHKLILAYLFEQQTEAIAEADAALTDLDVIAGFTYVPVFYFYDSLARLRLWPEATLTEQETILTKVSTNQTRMNTWAKHAPMNYQHKYDLVEAEKHRVLDDRAEAIDLYDRAIAGATANDYIQEAALANELAAKFYLDWDKPRIAANYLQQAYENYSEWGARAKLVDLENHYPQLLASVLQRQPATANLESGGQPFSTSEQQLSGLSSSLSSTSNFLDLATILKASQAISQEIQLECLISTLMQVLMENTGAQTGTLILKSDGGWRIAAYCPNAQICEFKTIPVADQANLPLSVIYYVQRTSTPVVLDQVPSASPFDGDPYWQMRSPKSVLCIPILKQSQLVGILYLENYLTVGAFTRDRQELTQLIAAQAAISIENAQFYRVLEEKVVERTQELSQALADLQAAQQDLIQSEKMAALGQLTASVAHEINTPLGVIRSATTNFFAAFNAIFQQLPWLLQQLSPQQQADFITLVQTALQQKSLSTRAERQLRRTLQAQFQAQGIVEADQMAQAFSLLRLEDFSPYPSLVRDRHASAILEAACHLVAQHQNVSSIQQEVDRAAKIVFALKSYTYQNSATESSLVDITEGIEVALTLFQNRLREGIEVVCQSDPGCPELLGNPDELIQVWVNLIDNAIHAMGQEGTLEIAVTTEGDRLRVKMTDSGTGIPAEHQARIFDPFFTTKARGEGSGLGLDIVRQIVQKHQGEIQVHSQPGRTTFTLYFPLPPQECDSAPKDRT